MDVLSPKTSDFFSKVYSSKCLQEIVPFPPARDPLQSTRVNLQKGRKPLGKDALQAVKLDPAVLEAQVTVDTSANKAEEVPPPQENLALSAKSNQSINRFCANSAKGEPAFPSFEEVLSTHQAALLGLSPQQLELLMAFVDALRRQRLHTQKYLECAFCKNNGEPVSWYSSHALRDRRRVRCPVLRALRCPRCGATGDRAHTDKYCPLNVFSDSWSCP